MSRRENYNNRGLMKRVIQKQRARQITKFDKRRIKRWQERMKFVSYLEELRLSILTYKGGI